MKCRNLVKKIRLQSYARHVDAPAVINGLEASCGAGGGPPVREGPQGRPMPPPLPFPRQVGFDACALTSAIEELYVLQLHLDHIGIPPEGCKVFTAESQVRNLEKIYESFGVKVNVEGVQADEIGHLFLKENALGLRYDYAESYAVVVHKYKLILIDESDDPKSVFERFKKRYCGYTIAIARVPYAHSAVSYLNNPWQVCPHWLVDNSAERPYAPNVIPKMLPTLLDAKNLYYKI